MFFLHRFSTYQVRICFINVKALGSIHTAVEVGAQSMLHSLPSPLPKPIPTSPPMAFPNSEHYYMQKLQASLSASEKGDILRGKVKV